MRSHSTLLFRFALFAAIAVIADAGCGEKKQEARSPRGTTAVVAAESAETKQPTSQGEPLPAAPSETARPVPSLTAQELRDQFTKDAKATKKKYESAALELSGTIELIGKGYAGETFLIFRTKGVYSSSRVGAQLTDPEPWAKLSPGQTVKLRGTCGFNTTEPYLVKSVIVEAGPNPAVIITAEQLAEEYAKDRKATLKKYLKKYFIVSGEVEKKQERESKFIAVYLKGSSGIRVECGFPGNSPNSAMTQSIEVGQKIKVFGQLFVTDLQEKDKVALSDCYLITGKEEPKKPSI